MQKIVIDFIDDITLESLLGLPENFSRLTRKKHLQ